MSSKVWNIALQIFAHILFAFSLPSKQFDSSPMIFKNPESTLQTDNFDSRQAAIPKSLLSSNIELPNIQSLPIHSHETSTKAVPNTNSELIKIMQSKILQPNVQEGIIHSLFTLPNIEFSALPEKRMPPLFTSISQSSLENTPVHEIPKGQNSSSPVSDSAQNQPKRENVLVDISEIPNNQNLTLQSHNVFTNPLFYSDLKNIKTKPCKIPQPHVQEGILSSPFTLPNSEFSSLPANQIPHLDTSISEPSFENTQVHEISKFEIPNNQNLPLQSHVPSANNLHNANPHIEFNPIPKTRESRLLTSISQSSFENTPQHGISEDLNDPSPTSDSSESQPRKENLPVHISDKSSLSGSNSELNPSNNEDSYSYGYDVNSSRQPNTMTFGKTEKRENGRITGRYYVAIPDGRTQVVTYYVDEAGYHATVTYYNEEDRIY